MLSPNAERMLMSIVPGVLLAGLYWGRARLPTFPTEVTQFLDVAPLVMFIVVAAVGWFFHRSKVVHTTIVIGAAFMVTNYFVDDVGAKHLYQYLVLACVAILTPLNLLVISLFDERRKLFSWELLAVIGLIALEMTVGYWVIKDHTKALADIVLFPTQLNITLEPWTKLTVPALVTSFIAILTMALQLARRFDLIGAGIFWACVACVLALDTRGAAPDFPLFILASTLFLGVALIQTWHDIAYLDQLTTLPGRLALNELLKNLSGRYVVAMVDVDFFKKFNDTYGHDVGDQILKLVASKLRNVTGGGHSFRYGGEEFTVVFPGKHVKEAFGHLSALREAIEEAHMILRHKSSRPSAKPDVVPQKRQPLRYLNVTVSIGIAENNEDLTTPTAVLKAADEALYRAKERGRNRLSL